MTFSLVGGETPRAGRRAIGEIAEADEAAEDDASGEQERIAALEAEISEKKRRCLCIG